jgi:hypothetical protein
VAVSGGVAAATAGVNALFHLLAARNLSESRYGELASAMTIIGVLGVAASGVQMSTARDIAAGTKTDRRELTKDKTPLISEALAIALVFLITFAVIGLGAANSALTSFYVPVVILISRANGEFHGRGLFVPLALFGLVLSVAKMLFGSAAILLFASVKISLVLQLSVALICALACLSRFGVSTKNSLTQFSSRLGSSVVMSALVWLIFSLDILLSRLKFQSDVTGNVALTSLFATTLLVVPQLVATVVYPAAVRRSSANLSITPLLFKASALSVLFPTLTILLALRFRGLLLDRLVGGSYELAQQLFAIQLASYIPVAGVVGIAPILLVTVRYRDLGLIAATVGLGSVTVITFSSSPREFMVGLVILHTVVFIEFLSLIFETQRSRKRKSLSGSRSQFGIEGLP